MLNLKNLTAGACAAALVSTLGLAYAQSSSDGSAATTPPADSSMQSNQPTYSSSDSGATTTPSADASVAPAADSSNTEIQSFSEPAPQADRN